MVSSRDRNEDGVCYAFLESTSLGVPLGVDWEEYNGESFQVNPFFTLTEVQDAVWGCMDPTALNFSPVATADDGSCIADLAVAPQTRSSSQFFLLLLACSHPF